MMFLVVCAAVAGCGGGDGDGESTGALRAEPAATGAAAESSSAPATEAIAVAKRVIETSATATTAKACGPAHAINLRSTYKFVCPLPLGAAPTRDFEPIDSERYGTGAVIDYRTKRSPNGASMVMFQAADGKWGISSFGLLTDGRSVGTSDADARSGSERVVERYLEAARAKDCEAYVDVVVLTGTSDELAFCRNAVRGKNPAVQAIQDDPAARPRYLGGNRYFGFHGLEVGGERPRYVTIVTAKAEEGAIEPFVILNSHLSPPSSG